MSTFQEKIQAIKSTLQNRITSDTPTDDITAINSIISDIDSLGSDYGKLAEEHAKTKDALVKLVTTEGNGDKPNDGAEGSKPMSIDECIAQIEKGGK